jgi:hypothetical protein
MKNCILKKAGLFISIFFLMFLSCSTDRNVKSFLPEQVSYVGPKEDYFLGSGVSGAMGSTSGIWTALLGPNYTSPDFLKKEILSIAVDGKKMDIMPEMHRGRRTGIYYGKMEVADITIYLVDFTNDKMPWVTRFVSVENSAVKEHRISIRANITPDNSTPFIIGNSAVSLYADTSRWTFDSINKESKNWADRYSLITFSTNCRALKQGGEYILQTDETTVNKGNIFNTALYHYQHYQEAGKHDTDYVNLIKSRNIERDLHQSISNWTTWVAKGNMYDDKVREQRAKDIIEGSLLTIKMLQDSSGGLIAGLGEYPHSYVRDSHGACRLFSITGHNEELKKVIETICDKTTFWGHIPNAWQMGANTWHLYKFNNPDAETPAYFVCLIKYYFENTGDRKFVERIFPFMKSAIDVQNNDMKANGWRIDFNGDETERYTVRKDGETYGMLTDWASNEACENWSFPSCIMALVSTRFFADYLHDSGRTELARTYSEQAEMIKTAIDQTFWRSDMNIHDWCRKRDNSWPRYRIPNYTIFPAWIGVELNKNRQNSDVIAMKQYINPENGYLPTAPGDVEGFSGHNLAYMLYVLKKLNDPKADDVYKTLMTAPIISCWGTVSEFYGPCCVPNGHLANPFSTGIMGEALLRYFIGFNNIK